jgi:hypothetical protein
MWGRGEQQRGLESQLGKRGSWGPQKSRGETNKGEDETLR